MGAGARARRLDRSRLARRVRRPRRDARRASDLLRGVRARRRSGARRHRRRGTARPHDRALRQRRAEAPLPARHPRRHRDLVPGLLRAQRRLRPRQRADARRARRRRVGDHRPESVDVARALVAVDLRAVPHRSRRAEAQGPVVLARADEPTGNRDPAHRADHRAQRVQRDVPRRGAHRGRKRRRRGERRLARRDGNARVRARCVDPRSTARVRQRAARGLRDRARERNGRRSGRAPAARRRVDHVAGDAHARVAHAADARTRRGRAGNVDPQVVLGVVPPRAGRARGRRARRGGDGRRRRPA